MDIERKSTEIVAINEAKLENAHSEVQNLRDQNDELSAQLDTMREKVKTLKSFQEKRSASNKRRKGSNTSNSNQKSLEEGAETDTDSPLEKIGKFHLHLNSGEGSFIGDISMYSDGKKNSIQPINCGSLFRIKLALN